MWLPPSVTLPSPAPPPLPDRIVLVTILVMRKVTRMPRNNHIMGFSESSPPPTEVSCTCRDAPAAAPGNIPAWLRRGRIAERSTARRSPAPSPRRTPRPGGAAATPLFGRLLDRVLDGLVRTASE